MTFLAKLAQGKLPVSPQAQADVKAILLMEKGDHWALYAKTGWHSRSKQEENAKNTGWRVGWIEKNGQIYAFALNLDGEFSTKDIENRILISNECLRVLGLLP